MVSWLDNCFVVSWGLGAIICGIAAWRKNGKATKIAAAIFFGLPVVFLGADLIRQKMIAYNFEQAKQEVKELCAKDGGDKIYKTVENVEGIFQMRARRDERQKGLRDQYGMFDPYGWAQGDHENPPVSLHKGAYWFFERQPVYGFPEGTHYRRTYLSLKKRPQEWQKKLNDGYPVLEKKEITVNKLRSRYGYITEDLTTNEMRTKWIGAGRIKIVDLEKNTILAERKGYFRASGPYSLDHWQWYGNSSSELICPSNGELLQFLQSVLKPVQTFPTNEQLQAIEQ